MDNLDRIVIFSIFVLMVAFISVVFVLKSDEEIEREASPKIFVENPYWDVVGKYTKSLDKILFLRDVLKCGGHFNKEGYIIYEKEKDFERAFLESVKITGVKPRIHSWKDGKFFTVKKYKVVLIYEK